MNEPKKDEAAALAEARRTLPVSEALPALLAALDRHGRAVLVAPPGAGKTTLVPLELLFASRSERSRILLVEPRRLAARAAARRMAAILGEEVGERVGWRMRLDTRVSPRTRIEVVTEGVFTRLVLADPELAGVEAVIFDEFHERSLEADLGLALVLDLREALRPDLRVVVMSATLDGARVATLLGEAPVVRSEGRAYPVEVRYRPRGPETALEEAVAAAVLEALAVETGSVLAFLPGQREIERTAERLQTRLPADTTLAPLFGQMEGAAQDLAIQVSPAGRRKVVLATAIAETSLTIEGVRVVVDGGFQRRPLFEPAIGLSRLVTVRASRAAAEQRAGRAGRTEPGLAVRLWRREEEGALAPFDQPEILSADLAPLVLDCASWGVTDPRTLPFLDPPPLAALLEAKALLLDLGALEEDGRLTALGEAISRLALPPRLAAMVAGAAAGRPKRLAAELAVLLTERGLGGVDPDLGERHRRLQADRRPRARAALQLAKRLAATAPPGTVDTVEPGALLALAYPDRIAVARGRDGAFLLANGREGRLDELNVLSRASLLVAAEIQGAARGARILSAAALTPEGLQLAAGDRIREDREVRFDQASGSVRARLVRRIGRATLADRPLPDPPADRVATALAAGLREGGLEAILADRATLPLVDRLRFVRDTVGEPWPEMDDTALLATLEDWLLPFLPGVSRLADITPATVREALLARLAAPLAAQLDRLVPTHYEAPTGSRLPIRYEEGAAVLAVRVQELFGLRAHPTVAAGRLPLTLELLSPAHRPIQVTRDLPGFWAGSWCDVRADLRGRYPRHSWPENPAEAAPTARAKPRGT